MYPFVLINCDTPILKLGHNIQLELDTSLNTQTTFTSKNPQKGSISLSGDQYGTLAEL